ncbi:succinylglutamate desuccinylase/aspartoacylase family protein [Piscinibacter sakaiensis]
MLTRTHPLPGATPGTQRHLTSFHYGPTDRGRKVYVQASLHADELPGMLVAHHLRHHLAALEAQDRLRAEVVVVPVANPIGLSSSSRCAGAWPAASARTRPPTWPRCARRCASRTNWRGSAAPCWRWPAMPTWCWTCTATARR